MSIPLYHVTERILPYRECVPDCINSLTDITLVQHINDSFNCNVNEMLHFVYGRDSSELLEKSPT